MTGPPIAPGRACGECSLCCKLLHVVELEKPAGVWCDKCRPGHGGCSIYETRPSICRAYSCGWLMSASVGEEWYPLRSHMILSLGPLNGVLTCTVSVEDDHPWSWREQPHYEQLQRMAGKGLSARKREEIFVVQVRCRGRVWLVTPRADVEITTRSYTLAIDALGEWRVETFDSVGLAAARADELTQATPVGDT
jgi:hypothetical protein